MIRRSPTTYEGGYTFYRNIAKWLVSKLGEKIQVHIVVQIPHEFFPNLGAEDFLGDW